MAIFYDEIPDKHLEWIARQKMFWVATAALNGHVNVSPKGCVESFHILNKNRVWYEDMTGSGVETIAHMREPGNARITIMFHAFEGAPRILRMWGTGTVHEFGTPEYDAFIPPASRKAGSRAAIVIDVHKVATSCGFGIPQYKFIGQRSQLELWCDKLELAEAQVSPTEKAPGGIKAWWTTENTWSLDGLPGLEQAHNTPLSIKNSYDRDAPRPQSNADMVANSPSSSKPFDGRLLVAFSLGVATTLAALRLASLRVH
ncbi:hypothetical protein EV363DRAFT_1215468 [Boletus edulis]|uniref:Pyridoxamine 5'-phosphate oxidase N-terminal domain-containing protein n=1 Tax=Boletus edulis BED1 TaxID=1328754 RepID=A0AAD4BPN9_BOLED|nr:hypothetical protein EV363DRAFT_1215468 [Boletus edulis]KAF8436282.1 hypothetical protein L210DRAFT_3549263 [Boletus edulis BED1]